MEIKVYSETLKAEWDEFIFASRNGTFIFQRDFMDYHSDRFKDHSLLFYHKSKLIAVLPGHIANEIYFSHQGLTFGSLVLAPKTTSINIEEIFEDLYTYLKYKGIKKLIYKPVPHIYHSYPTEEDLYILFQAGATLKSRNIASTLRQENRLEYSRIRKRLIKKATVNKVSVFESDDLGLFWPILEGNLKLTYDAKPVHSLAEMQLLKNRFPNNIRLFCSANKDNKVIGGIVIFETPQVAHAQYSSADVEGKETGALDILYSHLIENVFADKEYFDFGTSNEDEGRYLNSTLIQQKESFGGRGIIYDTYELLLT